MNTVPLTQEKVCLTNDFVWRTKIVSNHYDGNIIPSSPSAVIISENINYEIKKKKGEQDTKNEEEEKNKIISDEKRFGSNEILQNGTYRFIERIVGIFANVIELTSDCVDRDD